MKNNTEENFDSIESDALQGVFREYRDEIKKALIDQSYTQPTPIQEKCMRPISEGKDLIGF